MMIVECSKCKKLGEVRGDATGQTPCPNCAAPGSLVQHSWELFLLQRLDAVTEELQRVRVALERRNHFL